MKWFAVLIRSSCMIVLLSATTCSYLEGDRLSIVFGGDVILGESMRAVIEQKGPNYLFENIREELSKSDFAVVNLECPATKQLHPQSKTSVFRAEPEWLSAFYKAGITHLNMSNDHASDQGREGIASTADNIRNAGMIPVGVGNNQHEACSPILLQQGGVSVAIFSTVLVPLGEWTYLPTQPDVCQASIDALVENVKGYKKMHPDVYVVALLHWGMEYQSSPTVPQRKEAKSLINAGVDAIVGHHAHMVQGFGWLQAKPVFYCVGNLIADTQHGLSKDGILVRLTFYKKAKPGVEAISYHINSEGKPIIVKEKSKREFFAFEENAQ